MNIQTSLAEASSHAGPVDTLFLSLLALASLFAIGVVAFVVFFVVKYRRGRNANRSNPVETNHKLEITWTVVPLLLALGVFVWSGRLYMQIYDVPADAMEIYVVAKQWMWKFQYPETGQIEVNTLRVPLNKPVKLTMTSEDVIHSLFVPAFRIKTDVLPGRYTTFWFTATEAGTYHLFCAEYCGTDHAGMGGEVIVMPEADYQAWASGGVAPGVQTAAQAGEQLFTSKGCIGCHPASGGVGPSLQGLYGHEVQLASGETVLVDDTYIRTSILRPQEQLVQGFQPVMPSFEGQLSEEQLLQLIAYIKELGGNAPDAGAAPAGATPAPQQGGNQ